MSVQLRPNQIVLKCIIRLQREVFKPVFTCPAAWCFAAIWAIAAIYLAVIGRVFIVLQCLFLLVIVMFFCAITADITKAEHKPKVKLSRRRLGLLLLQIAVIAFSVIVQATAGLVFGIIFQRTRNLLACSVIHVVTNSLFN